MLGIFMTIVLVCVILYAIINDYVEEITKLLIATGIWYIGYQLANITDILHKMLLRG